MLSGTWKSARAFALFAMVMDPRRVRNMKPCLGSSTWSQLRVFRSIRNKEEQGDEK